MDGGKSIEVDAKAIERLKKAIVIEENDNLRRKAKSDSQMVAWIKKKIEEEVKCCSNQ